MPFLAWVGLGLRAPFFVQTASIQRSQVVSKFGSLKNFIASFIEGAWLLQFEDKDCRLTTAALLARVATVDREMAETRRKA